MCSSWASGSAGRTVAARAALARDPYTAVDADAGAVRAAAARGEPVEYGDAARRVRSSSGCASAPRASSWWRSAIRSRRARWSSLVRALAPRVPVLVRTHFVLDADALAQAGATRVVVEELESTLELVGATLRHFGVPEESIARFAAELREEGYVFMRTPETILDPWLGDLLEGIAAEWVEVPASSRARRRSPSSACARRTGASIVAVQRAGSANVSPTPGFAVRPARPAAHGGRTRRDRPSAPSAAQLGRVSASRRARSSRAG
jgi:CPA2 family monovalent cation:H+ antiporter-2